MASVVSRTVEQETYPPHPSRGGQTRLVLYHAKVYDSERYMTHFT